MNEMEWIDTGQKIVPWFALVVALGGFFISLLSLRITKAQANERQVKLYFGLNDLWFTRRENGDRIYALDITVMNRASVANSIIRLELTVTYSLISGHEVRLRLPVIQDKEVSLPIRLDSFQSISPTFNFQMPFKTIPDGARIESYSFEFTENSGGTHEISPTLVIEKQNLDATTKN